MSWISRAAALAKPSSLILRKTASLFQMRPALRSLALTALLLLASFYTLYLAEGFFDAAGSGYRFQLLPQSVCSGVKKLWIPEAAGAGLVMLTGVFGLGLLVYQFSGPVSEWVSRAPRILGSISTELQKLKKPVEKVTQAAEQVSRMAQVAAADQGKKPAEVEVKRPEPGGDLRRRDIGGFLWGILGIFLAVPAQVMLKIFCDQVEPLAPIGEFLGN